jgi:uncharacterized sulfatase
LQSDQSGLIDSTRDWVITGRERHVAQAREGNLPYPSRAIRTPDYVYIRNFEPDRWPMGSPSPESALTKNDFETNTFATFPDLDSSPTKAWLIEHRSDPQWHRYYDLAFGKRTAEELYDVHKDPDMIANLATDPEFATVKDQLAKRLLDELVRAQDPRVVEVPPRFEQPPFTDPPSQPAPQKQ